MNRIRQWWSKSAYTRLADIFMGLGLVYFFMLVTAPIGRITEAPVTEYWVWFLGGLLCFALGMLYGHWGRKQEMKKDACSV